ncbi:hypothetical protein RM533_02900 [Croceicoccus sp. F390]|uniref:CD-NTase-associated protein 12/Pycsar effector protein TIR domain-containing protein n=1 Tax=Croceicoccus esteveae TaxID=3075597 RepID=A0ABU2ZFK0_9SPHN|nr:hypothetical protein [Croceicoccus sp. F390]MDT0575131.1 hypothetical protein [Croceicoccus sp. F390]
MKTREHCEKGGLEVTNDSGCDDLGEMVFSCPFAQSNGAERTNVSANLQELGMNQALAKLLVLNARDNYALILLISPEFLSIGKNNLGWYVIVLVPDVPTPV